MIDGVDITVSDKAHTEVICHWCNTLS